MAKEKSVSSKFDGLFGPEDPTKLFELLEELAVGSYGTVYKVRTVARDFRLASAIRRSTSLPPILLL